jgi:predicted methyltransferase
MMKLERVLSFAKTLLEKTISPGDIAIDATLGNGHDTLYLANLVGSNGKVYGFDIQEQAVSNSRERLSQNQMLERTILFQQGHEHILELIPANHHGKITAAIFNLGYLPGSDKSIVTKPNTTISAIQQLLQIMAPSGMIVLVVYHGHPEGAKEKEELMSFVQNIDQKQARVLLYQFLNQQNHPPFIVAIEKAEEA